MPHHVTNRRRRYRDGKEESCAQSFSSEALNASAYILGGVAFTVGSVFFLPALATFQGLGVWLFIIGSGLYLMVTVQDLHEVSIHLRRGTQTEGRRRLEWSNALLYTVGSLLFLIGSVFFLPSLEARSTGAWCFIAGSVVFVLGAAINVRLITRAGSLLMLQLFNSIAILFIVGSALFVVGSIPYLWQDLATPGGLPLRGYLAGQYIAGSSLFLAGGLVNCYRAWIAHRHHSN